MVKTRNLNTAQLIDAVVPVVATPHGATHEDIELVGRRIRYWTTSQILRPVGGTHIGRGRSREYDETEIPIVAALMMLAEVDQGVEVLSQVATHLRNISGPEPLIAAGQPERWQQALARNDEDIFLFAGVGGRGAISKQRLRVSVLIPISKFSKELPPLGVGVFVNLSLAFRLVGI